MANENKPAGAQANASADANAQAGAQANSGPSADELRKQNEELAKQIKDRDSKIADLETTRATIEARQRQLDEDRAKHVSDDDMKSRISRINERRAYDPDGADAEMASLLSEVKTQTARDAVVQAQQIITQQTALDKLRNNIKSNNPEFDDDIVDVIMTRADQYARAGKYKTADDAIREATVFVKQKFESYAHKKNSAPPLPDGARAEGGGANTPPASPQPQKEKSPIDEIEEANAEKYKKLI